MYGIINGSVDVNARRGQEAGVPFVLRDPATESRIKTFGIIARLSKYHVADGHNVEKENGRTKKGESFFSFSLKTLPRSLKIAACRRVSTRYANNGAERIKPTNEETAINNASHQRAQQIHH